MAKMINLDISKQFFSTKKFTAIFFDLDNTLIPTRNGDLKACKKLADTLQDQYGFSRGDAQDITSAFLEKFRSCPDNPQTTLDSWRSYLWSQCLPDNLKHLSTDIYKNWLHLRYKYLALTKKYDNLLKILKNQYHLALITNGPSNAQWEKINKLNLIQYFDCILVSSDLPWEKPNPNIFLTACNFLNVKPNECLMIGDKLETDIKGGKDAKLGATIWIPLNHEQTLHDIDPVPDLIVENLCDILNYLPTNNNNCNNIKLRRHSQTATSFSTARKTHQYRRVLSLSEIECNSDNSSDCS